MDTSHYDIGDCVPVGREYDWTNTGVGGGSCQVSSIKIYAEKIGRTAGRERLVAAPADRREARNGGGSQ